MPIEDESRMPPLEVNQDSKGVDMDARNEKFAQFQVTPTLFELANLLDG